MAARWNSSRAPERPRNRIRSKPWCVFRCAKRISTFLRSLRDLTNSGVPIKARVASRASLHVARDLSKGHIRSALGLERTWTAVAGARAINNGSTIVHRPGRPEKLTLRADVEVTLPIEGKVGTRQDALFPLAHVPNRDVRHDAGADDPMEELASAVRRVCGQPFGLEPQSL